MTQTVLSILNAVSAVPGKNDKVAILEAHKTNENLCNAFYLAYNGLISFYIKKLPEVSTHTGKRWLSDALQQLGNLSNRTYTGHAAIAYVKEILEECSADDAEVVRRVLGRDLRIGASDGSADKVWPGLIPSFNVMLATAYSDKALAKIKFPAYAQLKADGSRTQAIVDLDQKSATFWTRNGKEVLLSKETADKIVDVFPANMAGKWVLDGEVVYRLPVIDANPLVELMGEPQPTAEGIADRATGNGIYNKAVKGTISPEEEAGLHFVVWDLIQYDQWQAGKSTVGYQARLDQLNSLNHTGFTSVIETHEVKNLDEATAIYSKYIALDLEGIILKNKNSLWENKRSKDQVKFKQVMSADLEVIEIVLGKEGKKYAEIAGTIRCKTSCGQLTVDASGMSDAERLAFWNDRDNMVGMIVEVEYNGIVKRRGTDVYSLFLPQFVQIRNDKTTANSLDELQAQKAKVSL